MRKNHVFFTKSLCVGYIWIHQVIPQNSHGSCKEAPHLRPFFWPSNGRNICIGPIFRELMELVGEIGDGMWGMLFGNSWEMVGEWLGKMS